MGGTTISASPARLAGAAPSFTGQAATVGELVTGLKSSASSLSGTLSVDPLTGFGHDLDTLSGRVGTSLDCFTEALRHFGHGLQLSSESFAGTDKQLASTFELIDQSLSPFLGFDSPALQVQPIVPVSHGRGFWGSIGHGLSSAWHAVDHGYHSYQNFRRRVQHDINHIPIIGPVLQPNDPGMPGDPVPVAPEIPVEPIPVP